MLREQRAGEHRECGTVMRAPSVERGSGHDFRTGKILLVSRLARAGEVERSQAHPVERPRRISCRAAFVERDVLIPDRRLGEGRPVPRTRPRGGARPAEDRAPEPERRNDEQRDSDPVLPSHQFGGAR